MWLKEKARGTNEGSFGLNCFSTQKGQTQSRLCWIAFAFTRPRAWKMIPARSSSKGSATSEGWAKRRIRATKLAGSSTP